MDYLLKSSVIITLFYLCYRLFLNKETFFQTNRWFLITGLLIAALLPSLVIPIYIEYTPSEIITSSINTNTSTVAMTTDTVEPFNWTQALFWIYILGTGFFLSKLALELISLHILIKKHPKKDIGRFSLIEILEQIAPFSFFKWIVYNPKQFKKHELNHIINHEKVHAKEHHSIDILIIQLACAIFWFNPFIWLYKNELEQNLEYIADKKAQSHSDCKKDYQRLLVKASLPTHQLAITNKFYNSLIKKRIVMLHKSKSNKLNVWKYVLILPVLGVFLMSFNTKEIYIPKEDKTLTLTQKEFVVSSTSTDNDLKTVSDYFKDKPVQVKFSDIERNSDNSLKAVTLNTKYNKGSDFTKRMHVSSVDNNVIAPFRISFNPLQEDLTVNLIEEGTNTSISKQEVTFGRKKTIATTEQGAINSRKQQKNEAFGKNPLYIINGTQYKKTDLQAKKLSTSNSITALNAYEGMKQFGKNGKDGVYIFNGKTTFENKENGVTNSEIVIIITKDFTDADLEKTKNDLKKEDVTIKFKGVKRNASGEIIALKIDAKSEHSNANFNISSDEPISPIRISIDQDNIAIGNMGKSKYELKFISEDGKKHKIRSNSSVYLIKDNNSETETETEIEFKSPGKVKTYTKVIELKEGDDEDEYEIIELKSDKKHKKKILKLKSISDSDESIKIIESDTLLFKGKNHAIEWHSDDDDDKNIFYINSDKKKTKHLFISDDDNSLFIINGKESTKEAFTKLDHDTIESIDVIKGDKATEMYGKKGENGVITITTKDKK